MIVTALGTGVQSAIAGEIESLGSNIIFIFPQSNQTSGVRARARRRGRLTEDDGEAIVREATSVGAVVAVLSAQAQVVVGDQTGPRRSWARRAATSPCAASPSPTGELDRDRRAAQDQGLRASATPCGERSSARRCGRPVRPHRALPVPRHRRAREKGQSPFGEDQDDRVIMPIGSFRARVMPTAPGPRPHAHGVGDRRAHGRARDRSRSSRSCASATASRPGDEPDFVIRTQAEFRKTQEEIFGTLRAPARRIARCRSSSAASA